MWIRSQRASSPTRDWAERLSESEEADSHGLPYWLPWFPAELSILCLVFVVFIALLVGLGLAELSLHTLDVLQVARNISEGRGWTTNVLRPLSLSIVPQVEVHPELQQPPVPAALYALIFAISDTPSTTVVVACSLCLLLGSAVLLHRLVHRLYGRPAAFVAAMLNLFYPPLVGSVLSGEPRLVASCWMCMWLLGLLRLERAERSALFCWGLCTGLLLLTSYAAMIPVLLAFWFCRHGLSHRWWGWPVFLMGLLPLCILWGVRNLQLTGNPFFSLSICSLFFDTLQHPADSVYQLFLATPSFWGLFSQELPDLLWKGIGNLGHWLVGNYLANGMLLLLCLIGLLSPIQMAPYQRLRRVTVVFGATLMLVMAWTHLDSHHLMLWPLLCLFAAPVIIDVSKRLPRRWGSGQVTATACAMVLLSFAPSFYSRIATPRLTPSMWNDVPTAIGKLGKSGQLLLSDNPLPLAWQQRQHVIWMPRTEQELRRIEERAVLDEVWLSPGVFRLTGALSEHLQISYGRSQPFSDQWEVDSRSRQTHWLICGRRPQLDDAQTADELRSAVVQMEMGNLDEAQKALHRILAQTPEHEGARWLNQRVSQWLEPSSFGDSADIQPPMYYYYLGTYWMEHKQKGRAIRAYWAALMLDPDHVPSANNLAWLLMETGELDDAYELAQYALHHAHDHPLVLDTTGWLEYQRGDPAKAVRLLREAVKRAPDRMSIQSHLDQVCQAINQGS